METGGRTRRAIVLNEEDVQTISNQVGHYVRKVVEADWKRRLPVKEVNEDEVRSKFARMFLPLIVDHCIQGDFAAADSVMAFFFQSVLKQEEENA